MAIKREPSRYNYDHTKKRSRFEGHEKKVVLPIFSPSGLLELDSHHKKGVRLKHVQPRDAVSPREFYDKLKVRLNERKMFQILVYKKGVEDEVQKIDLYDKNCYVVGRVLGESLRKAETDAQEVAVADIPIAEEGCSKEHCAVLFREVNERLVPYLIDLDSSNGTSLNDQNIPSARYIELKSGDVIHVSEDSEDTEYELIFVAA